MTLAPVFAVVMATYVSPGHRFELRVPSSFSVQSGKEKSSRSYMPVCHPESAVCFNFPNAYPGTNFGDASVEVYSFPAKTKQTCLVSKLPNSEIQVDKKAPYRVIDGVRFVHGKEGGVAMSHFEGTDRYRGYRDGLCIELDAQITESTYEVYERGSIKKFTDEDQTRVRNQLLAIVDSFRFLAPEEAAVQ